MTIQERITAIGKKHHKLSRQKQIDRLYRVAWSIEAAQRVIDDPARYLDAAKDKVGQLITKLETGETRGFS